MIRGYGWLNQFNKRRTFKQFYEKDIAIHLRWMFSFMLWMQKDFNDDPIIYE